MSVLSIPTSSDPFYEQTTQLDGTDYLFEFRYNQREDAWYFTISLADETELLAGIKIVCGTNLFRRGSAELRLPRGVLAALPVTPDTSPPGLNDLGEDARVTLVYYSADEF